jgi:hypothetical protein
VPVEQALRKDRIRNTGDRVDVMLTKKRIDRSEDSVVGSRDRQGIGDVDDDVVGLGGIGVYMASGLRGHDRGSGKTGRQIVGGNPGIALQAPCLSPGISD